MTDSESLTVGKCRRWSKQKKYHISIQQPVMIQKYNKGMGGVDLFDQFRGKYRVSFRKRVWYYSLFRFLVNSSVVNGWLLFRKMNKVSELDFLREIVNILLRPCERPRKSISIKLPDLVRYDGIGHDIVMGDKQRRCVCKKKKS